MESLVYLIICSYVVLFQPRYNEDSVIDCWKDFCDDGEGNCAWLDGVDACKADTSGHDCDCQLSEEVMVTKLLLMLAWAFANLSGDVFFGAFNSMRQKFGTNERNIVNVMEKRDWAAFSEMLQFGYRMNRYDEKSQRSGLSTFLDRIPSDKFYYEEIEEMIRLGANINDVSIKPKDEKDNDEPLKVGDNVLIRYIKVTPCEFINFQFDAVVKKWTTTGVTGGAYPQNLDRIRIDINAKNDHGYSAFKVYWEKLQYERRNKNNEITYVHRRKTHLKKEFEFDIDAEQAKKEKWDEIQAKSEEEKTESDNEYVYEEYQWPAEAKEEYDMAKRKIDDDEQELKQWFTDFYAHLIKWQQLGADMSTVSEDGVCPLTAYVKDMDNEDISMEYVILLCPIDGECPIDNAIKKIGSIMEDEEEEKYELHSQSTFRVNTKEYFVPKKVREQAFDTWYRGHNFTKKMFEIEEIRMWYELGATGVFQKLLPLNTYLTTCEVKEQTTEVIDALVECGVTLENKNFTQYPCKCPLPIVGIIDEVYQNRSAKINLDIIQYLHDEYKVPIETNGVLAEHWTDVIDPETYTTQLAKYVKHNNKVSLEYVKNMIDMGFIVTRREQSQKYIRDAVGNRSLPFDVFEFLLNNFVEKNTSEESKTCEEELDNEIFNTWLRVNDHITFAQIKTLVEKYGFSPYQSNNSSECAIHYIWKNSKIPFSVMYDMWKEYGEKKFVKFDGVYEGFLFEILEKRRIRKVEEIQYLEEIFSDFVGKADSITGDTWIHGICKNKSLKLEILQYICNKYKDQWKANNKNGDKPIHLLCKNEGLSVEHLKYFVVDLGIPMDITNDEGFQPYEALHYLVDNKSAYWDKKDMEIMIEQLKIDFTTRRAGEIILYRISKDKNWSIEALIKLYKYYKRKFGDPNSKNYIDLNALKSAKEMWREKTSAGGTTILNNLLKRRDITPNQIETLVKEIGFDILAKDNDSKTVLHTIARSDLTQSQLRTVGTLMRDKFGKDFRCDMPDKNGVTPYQLWLHAKESYICWDMDVVEVWEELGADITQNEKGGANNMLHHYISGYSADVRLAHLRKMCFDVENPWRANEQTLVVRNVNGTDVVVQLSAEQLQARKANEPKKKKIHTFQLPLHAKAVPNNGTLFRMYFRSAIYYAQPININVLEYFRGKKDDGVRAVVDTTESPLWLYMRHKHISKTVVKYLIEDMGCAVTPTEQDNLLTEYFTWLSRREKMDWDLLDYFYTLHDDDGNTQIDFKFRQREYVTILHKYCHQLDSEDTRNQKYYQSRYYRRVSKGSKNIMFNCADFQRLINEYDLQSILDEWCNKENKKDASTNPSPAALFYEHRAHETRADIIQLFHKDLGFDIRENINNRTPLQNYCAGGRPARYIMKSIVKSFIDDGGADPNYTIPGQSSAAMCQVMANSVDIKSLQMMVETFNVSLINAKKRQQDVWYTFMDGYSGGFDEFVPLMQLYIDMYRKNKFIPIHLFHNHKKDQNKRIQYKLYQVFRYGKGNTKAEKNKFEDSIPKFTVKEAQDLKLKKNKKKLKIAKKWNERIVIVTDSRDGLFRACKPIDARSYEDGQQKEVLQKWLWPVSFEQIIDTLQKMQTIYKSYHKPTIGQKLSKSLIIIDFETINGIYSQIQKVANDESIVKKQTINDIKLRSNNNILQKYIKSNHRKDINFADILKMKEMKVEFKWKNDSDRHALDIYCRKSKGEIDKKVVQALVDGGCPINWPFEESKKKESEDHDSSDDEEDDLEETKEESITELSKKEKEVIKGDYTPLMYYGMLKESNLNGFRALVECGADVGLESRENVTCIYYLLEKSENLTAEFIEYLVQKCKINFNRVLPSGWCLFNHYLNHNKYVNKDTIIALCDIAECDAHSRDDENDTSSIKAYIQSDIATFKFEIISCLVELGALINEPDGSGITPIQNVLQLEFTPIQKLMDYLCNMIMCGARLTHILPDDPLSIDDNKLFVLQNMKDGYENYNKYVCRVESWTWGRKKKQKIQTAIALDTFGATKLYIRIRRQNLIDVTQQMLFEKYPKFKTAVESQSDMEVQRVVSNDASIVVEEAQTEQKGKDREVLEEVYHNIEQDNTAMEMQSLTSAK